VGFHFVKAAAALRFLIVEDHEIQRRLLSSMLARLGATDVLEACDAESALCLLREALPPVDIVISDLGLPGMDGIEFIRTVGALELPVVMAVVSTVDGALLASVETMAAAYNIPLLGVLRKPLTLVALQGLITRYRRPVGTAGVELGSDRLYSAQEVRGGLDRDEFEPFFQPKVELANGRVRGFEALARWRHPQAGVLGPQAFLLEMEAQGWIDDLTWTMLRKSAQCCRRWRTDGHDLSVSVNLSVSSLADVQLADRVAATVSNEGLEPGSVVLELTETAAAGERLGEALENLARLRLKGFGLAIDDFGTGYSSLQQLSRVAFTELKIDRSFVTDAAVRQSAMVVLQSSLEMARRLNLKSVAEGIETAAEWNLLRALGCDLAQGYFIAAAMEARSVAAWIHSRSGRARPRSR
jgi:EAL domain-containing protein (putative c-di-GMP-specific phosphodiesterase class I)